MADTRQFLAGTAVLVLFAGVTLGVVGLVVGGTDASPSLNAAQPPPAVTNVNPTDPSSDEPGANRSIARDTHSDFNMTQYMSSPGAAGPMFTGATVDPQLRHSQDPAFVRELEEHQQDMDRMLGRGQP